ncbi:MAG TPA: tRNA epoxyqueuosine(34) reductase QueG [Aggregatilineales bacterium]|nr:tRNA epoxyqueuosine(34) reductase QueG [Aggregatilineales bacterium]
MFSAQALKERATESGFNLVGIAPATPSPRLDAYLRWVDAGMHGTMAYMTRPDRVARRRDLNEIVPGARSIIVVGLDYHALRLPDGELSALGDPARGRIAAYAWGSDYHDIMTPALESLAAWLTEQSEQTGGASVRHRVYVDTGAILERSHAQQAGLGFVGKNTMLIHPRRGSYFFLGEIVTDLAFDAYDDPQRETMCGTCNRCRTACPTDAFPQPYVLDARRCISYLTIEHKGWIDPAMRPLMGNWVFGCDICQDVCPFSRFVTLTRQPAFIPTGLDRAAPTLLELLALDDANFRNRFASSALMRIGRDRLVRNACIAAGNWRDPEVFPALLALLEDPNPLVRGHAAWAIGRNNASGTRDALKQRRMIETDDNVLAEIDALENMF